MAQIVSVPLTNEPGSLAHPLLSLAARGVEVQALDVETFGEVALVRMLVADGEAAASVLREAGHPVQVLDALLVSCAGGTAALGEIARRLGLAGVAIQNAFASADAGTMVLVVDDQERALEALATLATAETATLVDASAVASGN